MPQRYHSRHRAALRHILFYLAASTPRGDGRAISQKEHLSTLRHHRYLDILSLVSIKGHLQHTTVPQYRYTRQNISPHGNTWGKQPHPSPSGSETCRKATNAVQSVLTEPITSGISKFNGTISSNREAVHGVAEEVCRGGSDCLPRGNVLHPCLSSSSKCQETCSEAAAPSPWSRGTTAS
ncbi:hypothetical protein GE09DRAFT_114022 [Coniochaeta sp. 2T2.1]|nr:hypothetical protein GE09DRAFT_114022 [Coniochaeta sp. 2T2.1]